MTVRQYIGARYIPIFSDPIQWDNTNSYEPLTVVMNEGTSYVSKQSVPTGIQITNETYWLRWADYNAQLAEYIRQVETYTASINALNDALPIADYDSESTVSDAITALAALLPDTDYDSENTVSDVINSVKDLLPVSAFSSTNTVDARFDTIEANGWVTESRLASNAVSSAKIVDGAVTNGKIAINAVDTAKIADGSITPPKMAERKIVCIGDSLTTGTGADHDWPYYLNQMDGYTTYNFAVGGQGFVNNSSGTFYSQVTSAINSQAFANSDITDVVVMGGFNDWDYSATQVYDAVGTLCNYINANFANAKVWVGAMLHGVRPLNYAAAGSTEAKYRSRLISAIESAARTYDAFVIETPWLWVIGEEDWNTGDGVHVLDGGQRFFAKCIYSSINGAPIQIFKQSKFVTSDAIASEVTELFTLVTASNGFVSLYGFVKVGSDCTGISLFKLPTWAYFSRMDSYNRLIPSNGNTLQANGAQFPFFASDGVYIKGYNLITNRTNYFEATWPMGL